jgi:Co/Zn/Cd efflux system component
MSILYIFGLFIGPLATLFSAYLIGTNKNMEKSFNNSSLLKNETLNSSSEEKEAFDITKMLIINIDPILSFFIGLFYLFFFGNIFKEALRILSLAVPSFIEVDTIKRQIQELDSSIKNVHDLHVYEWTPFQLCITLHFVMKRNNGLESSNLQVKNVSKRIELYLSEHYMIRQVHLQPEIIEVNFLHQYLFSLSF